MPNPTVLITGGTGLLGKTLLETAPADVRAIGTTHRRPAPEALRDRFLPLELTDRSSVERLFEEARPQAVIHTASIGEVDEAERDPGRVRAVNVEGTRLILDACRRSGAALIFISSNAVFDGTSAPYREDAPLKSVNRYGQIKIEAERLLGPSGVPHLIVRPILMYGWPLEGGRENAVTRWLQGWERGRPAPVAEEIVSMPLWVGDCACAVWTGLARGKRGIVHVGGPNRVTMVEFAREVCRCFRHDEHLVQPVSSGTFGHLAPRPRDTSFDLTRLRQEFGIEPLGIREGLTRMRRQRSTGLKTLHRCV